MARLHEYQGKPLVRHSGILTAHSEAARPREEAKRAAAGEVAFASTSEDAGKHTERMFGMQFGTFPVTEVLIEEKIAIAQEMVVGGVTPGKGGSETLCVPVFDSCRDAVARLDGIDFTVLFVPALSIKDAALRERVAAVWDEALTKGCGGEGWTFDEIRAIPFTLLVGKIDLQFVEHLNSCCKRCITITKARNEVFGSRVPVNLDMLIAGSLLADVRKMLEFDKDPSGEVTKGHYGDMLRHLFSGVAMCYRHGIPPEVMHIVTTHSHEGDEVERTIESWNFHHADFIDFDIAKVLGKQTANEPVRKGDP